MGIVEEAGPGVRTIKKGDRVIAPFAFSDGDCEFCRKGLQTSCLHAGFWGMKNDGGQGEMVRAPYADANLVVLPQSIENDAALLKAVLPLTDVMGTGHHAAVCAGVSKGATVAVVGDGAVGLCGVLAARRLGAERIIVLGHRAGRMELAKTFGATDPVMSSGDEAIGPGAGNDQRWGRSRARMRGNERFPEQRNRYLPPRLQGGLRWGTPPQRGNGL